MSPRERLRRWSRIAVLVVGLIVLVAWQWRFTSAQSVVDERYRVTAATGVNRDQDFVFYLYHLGVFPLATDAKANEDSKREAERLLHDHPGSLVEDRGTTFRSGDRGRTFLFLLDCWLRKRPLDASIRPAHAVAFTTAIAALFVAFWAIRRPLAGFVLCVLLGSNSFQLFAVYRQENVFGWGITAMMLMLAINLPLMTRKPLRAWYPFAAAIVSGVVLALVRTVRSEPSVLLLALFGVYVTATTLPRWRRVAVIVALCTAFAATGWGSVRFFERKLQQTNALVASVGGTPYQGPHAAFHEFWHTVFCGLGDYDTEKGYAWDDRVAYAYAYPELHRRHPELALDPKQAVQPFAYDTANKYPVMFFEVEGYHDIIRDKVVHDIRSHPRWYLRILRKRIWRVLTETTPVGIALHDERYQAGGALLGLLCVPLAVFLAIGRRWFQLKLLLFSVPLSIAPLIVHSDGGMTNLTTFHIFGAFTVLTLATRGAVDLWFARRRSTALSRASAPQLKVARDSDTVGPEELRAVNG